MEEEILGEIQQLKKLIQDSDRQSRPWTCKDIAWYCQVKVSTVMSNYTKRKDFPKPIGVGDRRWRPEDIKNWFNRYQA